MAEPKEPARLLQILLGLAIAGWVLFVALFTGVSYVFSHSNNAIAWTNYRSAAPESAAFSSIEVWRNDLNSASHPFMLMTRVNGSSSRAVLELDVSTKDYLILDSRGNPVSRGYYDGATTVRALFLAIALDSKSATIDQEAAVIDEYIQRGIQAPQSRFDFPSSGPMHALPLSSPPPQPAYQLAPRTWTNQVLIIAVGFVACIVGIAGLVRLCQSTWLTSWRRRKGIASERG